ncbi:MAG: COX15/CtaA family protein, partial [Halobacteriaceae archaeon]
FLGLFPANFASFIEWFHRLVAMIVGLLIIFLAWRTIKQLGTDSRITRATLTALALLPLQVALGALTVLKLRLFGPRLAASLGPYISVTHYGTGVLLFSALLAATLWSFEDDLAGQGSSVDEGA